MSRDDEIRGIIEAHPQGDRLARLVRAAALAAADERRARFGDGLDELAKELEIASEEATVDGVHVLKVLLRAEPPVERGRRVLGALLARGISIAPPESDEEAARLSEALSWLAANTHLDGLSSLSSLPAAEESTARIWRALSALVRAADERGAAQGRGAALAAALALSTSEHEIARLERVQLRPALREPLLSAALATGGEEEVGEGAPVRGELVPAPHGPVALFFWCVSGLILVRYAFRFVGSVLLRAKRPAELTVDPSGITLAANLDLLGRRLRERRIHIPAGNLARAEREVRYPRLALYAGLLSLALGTFIGASLFTDGARAGSPSLIGLGAAIFAIGVALDLVIGTLIPARQRKFRLVFVPRKGRALALRVEDEAAADRALRELVRPAA